MALTSVAAWGGHDTPFQLAGQLRIAAAARIVRRVGVGLLDLGDRCWRDAYDGQVVHPCEAADDAIDKEAAGAGCEP